MLVNEDARYAKASFDNEQEIEDVVQKYAQLLFGSTIIFLPKAKLSTIGGHGTVPDGFVIDVLAGEWFIVEAERAAHGVWEHIVPQVSKQIVASESPENRQIILKLIFNILKEEEHWKEVFAELGIRELEISEKLRQILDKPPTIAIPIDEIPNDLQVWASTLKNTVKIWLIEKYVSLTSPQDILYSLPEEGAPTITTKSIKGHSVSTTNFTGSQPFQDLIEERLLNIGQVLTMEYGPRGRQRQSFTGVVQREGIEVDGQIFAPSPAAEYCMRQAGNNQPNANGWINWKTEDGTLLSKLRDRLMPSKNLIDSLDLEPEIDA
jgi:hypothetical protein